VLDLSYPGHELAAMAQARNYYAWMLAECRSCIGRVVLEHGAGIGTFSELVLRDAKPDRLLALEPAANLVPLLRQRLAAWGARAEVLPYTLEQSAPQLRERGIDTVVSVNVLEHIADDRKALRAMAETLPAGGRVILFVPALPWLYGSLDAAFEHCRRYAKQELIEKVESAGFVVESVRFMNLPGVLAWLMVGRVMRRRILAPGAVRFYDRWILPVVSWLERLQAPPIGQNLLVIARREAIE
jgi:SAM-dependent methyltransferase